MTRNLIVLGCAGLLAFGLSFGTFAGSVPDADGDGVPDAFDNCRDKANGGLASTGQCDGQEDADSDGYGNACDYDYNNNNASDSVDLSLCLDNANLVTTNLVFDGNCNGGTDSVDLSNCLDNANAVQPVGPSGLACAGVIPCPAP
jgi:hypothetical protein